jgi:hypothetical protein
LFGNKKNRVKWESLMDKLAQGTISSTERRELARLEINGHYVPAQADDYMPTSLGNVLKAAESIPFHKYGLDAVICWPRLWLLLPKETREILGAARQSLDKMVELWSWAIVISLGWMIIAYLLSVQAARTYVDLIESAFDLHRWSLYESVRWDVPRCSGSEEIVLGKKLTEFL